jgi:hypothetical protein
MCLVEQSRGSHFFLAAGYEDGSGGATSRAREGRGRRGARRKEGGTAAAAAAAAATAAPAAPAVATAAIAEAPTPAAGGEGATPVILLLSPGFYGGRGEGAIPALLPGMLGGWGGKGGHAEETCALLLFLTKGHPTCESRALQPYTCPSGHGALHYLPSVFVCVLCDPLGVLCRCCMSGWGSG